MFIWIAYKKRFFGKVHFKANKTLWTCWDATHILITDVNPVAISNYEFESMAFEDSHINSTFNKIYLLISFSLSIASKSLTPKEGWPKGTILEIWSYELPCFLWLLSSKMWSESLNGITSTESSRPEVGTKLMWTEVVSLDKVVEVSKSLRDFPYVKVSEELFQNQTRKTKPSIGLSQRSVSYLVDLMLSRK